MFSVIWEQRLRIAAVLRILATRTPALITALTLLCAGGSLLGVYVERSERYEAVVGKVLTDAGGGRDQPALQALLLSSVDSDAVTALRNEKLDSSFEETWNQLVTEAAQPLPDDAQGVELMVDTPGAETLTEYWKPDESNRTPGYLFAPYFLLIPPLDRASQEEVIFHSVPLIVTPRDLQASSRSAGSSGPISVTDQAVYTQVALSKAIAESMQRLAGNPMIAASSSVAHLLAAVPVQAYVVMSGGITRVFMHDDPNPTTFFGSQFPTTTFFPSRPYFWPTFNDHPSFFTRIVPPCRTEEPFHPNEPAQPPCAVLDAQHTPGSTFSSAIAADTTIGQFFRVSQPYLDLGGSGVVITLTRGLIIDGVGSAVICIDLRFDDNNGVLKALDKTIKSLNGNIFSVACDVSFAAGHLNCTNEEGMTPEENQLFYQVKNEFSRTPTQVLSDLYRFDSGTTVRFSLPLDRTINNDGSQRLTLVLASFDPSMYKVHTSIIAFSAATAFAILTAFIAYLWGSLEVGWSRYSAAFGGVDGVMASCPTPYARLDTDDRIIAANPAFSDLLKIPLGDILAKKPTLRSLCYDDSARGVYDQIEALRKAKETVAPYKLILGNASGQPVPVRIHSAAIPSDIRDSLPGTFGILIQQ
jgi:PAS domain-containing protein